MLLVLSVFFVSIISKLMKLLFFSALLLTFNSFNYADSNITINSTILSTGPIANSSATNICRKVVSRSGQMYHMTATGIYQSWNPGNLNSPTVTNNLGAIYVNDIGVSNDGYTSIFSYMAASSTSYVRIYEVDTNYAAIGDQIQAVVFATPPNLVFINGPLYYTYYIDGYGTGISRLDVIDKATGTSLRHVDLGTVYSSISITPDYTKAVIWSSTTSVLIYRLTDLVNVATYTPTNAPSPGSTKRITFSSDSSLALIQTDATNNLVIFSMSTYTVVAQIATNQTIKETHFMDNTNQMLFVITYSGVYLVDLANNQKYALPGISGTILDTDRNGNIYSCYNNIVSQTYVTYTRPTNSSPTSPSSSGSNSIEEKFYMTLNASQTYASFYESIDDTQGITGAVTSLITTFGSSVPLTVYFLGFLNYFTLSSIYVLLNIRIPQQVYRHLASMYSQVNANLFDVIDFSPNVQTYSRQLVDSERALFFGVSSDLLSSNMTTLLVLASNLVILFGLHLLATKLRKGSWLKKTINQEKWDMLYGQIINTFIPLTLPWSFILLKHNLKDMGDKVNFTFYIIFFMIILAFPHYYLLQLLRANSKAKTKEHKEQSHKRATKRKLTIKKIRSFNQEKNQVKPLKIKKSKDFKQVIRTDILPILPSISQEKGLQKELQVIEQVVTLQKIRESRFKDLFTWQVAEAWYLCEANFLLPALVLFDSPVFFLILVLFFLMFGLMIAFHKPKWSLNAIFLAIYPLLFHICFMIFHWSSSVPVLLITQMICLLVFLMGSLHHCLTLVLQILALIYTSIRDQCRKNKIVASEQNIYKNVKAKENKPKKQVKIKQMPRQSKLKLKQLQRLSEDQLLKEHYQSPQPGQGERYQNKFKMKRNMIRAQQFECETPQPLRHSVIKSELAVPQGLKIKYFFNKKDQMDCE